MLLLTTNNNNDANNSHTNHCTTFTPHTDVASYNSTNNNYHPHRHTIY